MIEAPNLNGTTTTINTKYAQANATSGRAGHARPEDGLASSLLYRIQTKTAPRPTRPPAAQRRYASQSGVVGGTISR